MSFTLRIAGFKSERAASLASVKESDSIEIVGTVRELKNEYERARLVIIPTRIAAGIAYKYTEALSFGVPCLVSTLIHGQAPASDELLPGCSHPEEFASQIELLYHSEEAWLRQRNAGLEMAERHFSRDSFDASLAKLVAS